MSGVGIVCFASSYAVTLLLEISRIFFRSGIRGAIMLGFAGAGLLAHTAYLFSRAAGAVGSPLSSRQDWYLVAAWVLAATYLYLTAFHRQTAFGLFILPLVLGLIGVGTFLTDSEPFAREPASKVWGAIHGTSLLLTAVAVFVATTTGLMYLGQVYRLKRKLLPRRGLRLPSLEWLRRANTRAIAIALFTLGLGILSGIVLNLVQLPPRVEQISWTDPLVLSSLAMFGWLLVSSVAGIVYKPAREGRKVALFTVLSFLFFVIVLAVMLFGDTAHGSERDGSESHPPEASEPAALGFRAPLLHAEPREEQAACGERLASSSGARHPRAVRRRSLA